MADDTIINVDKKIATLSLGYSIDAGGSVAKLVYRSKKDYENGVPKDKKCGHGKLHLRNMDKDDGDALYKFLQLNCDITPLRVQKGVGGESERPEYYQTGISCQQWLTTLDDGFKIKTLIASESDIQMKGLREFYAKSGDSDMFQRLQPLSTTAVEKARSYCLSFKNGMDHFATMGEKSFWAMMNRPAPGFDAEEYKQRLTAIDVAELAKEMSVDKIEYPCILVGFGSAVVIYLLHEDGSSPCLTFLPFGGKSFLNLGKFLPGAKDFNELAEMAGRGDSRKVDICARDTRNWDHTAVNWYTEWNHDLMIYSFGKLGDDKYKGTYNNDDIAASLARVLCSSTANVLAMQALMNGVKSIVFSGSFMNHQAIREYMEECFVMTSLCLPFVGGYRVKMTSLPNPGFVCALGTWLYNLEIENAGKEKKKDSKPYENGSAEVKHQNGSAELKHENGCAELKHENGCAELKHGKHSK